MKEHKFKVEPEALDLAEIVERLGAILAYYRGRTSSTHERTKDVWGALKTLLRLSEKKWQEWIPLIAERYVPNDLGKTTGYFHELLTVLLNKFAEEVRGYTPAMKLHLAKIIRSALDSASAHPEPQIKFFIQEFYPEKLSSNSNNKEVIKSERIK
jgi:hypothetical protein